MEINLNALKNNNYWKVLLSVYLLLLFKAGFSFNEQYSKYTATLLIAVLLIVNGRKIIIKSNILAIAGTMLGLLLINYILNGFPTADQLILILFNIVTAVLIVDIFSKKEFLNAFSDLIYIMCIASIIGFVLMFFFKEIVYLFPNVTNSRGRVGYFAIFTIISDFSSSSAGLQRVQGVFWEPGAFQAMIVFAFLFQHLLLNNLTKRRIIVYTIAIILTFSTTGYICLAMMWILLLNKNSKPFGLLRVILIAVVLCLLYLSFSSTSISFLQYTMFGKIEMVLNYQEGVSTNASSRVDSVIMPLKNFISDPIFGIGQNGYLQMAQEAGHSMFTCTPINYLVRFGIIFAGIHCWGIYRFFKENRLGLLNGILITFCLCLTLSTEAFTLNPIITCLVLYGFKDEYVSERGEQNQSL